MTHLLILICALYGVEFLFAWLLDCLNLNSILKNRSEVPARFTDSVSTGEYEKSVAYSLRKGRFALTSRLGSTLFVLLLLLSSFPGPWRHGFLPSCRREGCSVSSISLSSH